MSNVQLAQFIKYRKSLNDFEINENSFNDEVLISQEIDLYLEYKNLPKKKKTGGGFGMAALGVYLMNENETKFFELIIERASKN